MLAVVVPAHNEQEHLGNCLASLLTASQDLRLRGETVLVVVVADACTDRTAEIARRLGAATVNIEARNVGMARAKGADFALAAGARWLAFTDADSVVAPDWLNAQLTLDADAVCGTVQVRDWGDYDDAMRLQHERTYRDVDGHSHIHGANLGVSALAYREVGGFKPLTCSEDVDLVKALQVNGSSIAWSAAPRVVTSARRQYRAPGGFGETLVRVERSMLHDSSSRVDSVLARAA